MATTNEIIEALRAFVTKIDETIVNGKREGVLRSTEEVYTRYRIDESLGLPLQRLAYH